MEERKLNLFGTEYLIKYVDEITREKDRETQYAEGLCSSTKRFIQVATKQPDDKPIPNYDLVKNTWHEVFHAILDEGQYCEYSNNEALVEWLARCVTSIIKQDVIPCLEKSSPIHSLQDPQLEIPFSGQEEEISRKSSNA